MKKYMVCLLMGMLLLTACGQTKELAVLSDLIPEMKEEGCQMGFFVGVNHHGDMYVQGDAEQTQQGLELLDQYDLTKLVEVGEPAEQCGWSGGDQVYLRWEDDGCRISRSHDREGQYNLRLTYDSGEVRCFVGEIARIEALETLRDTVIGQKTERITLYTQDVPQGYHPSVAYACMGLDDLEDHKSRMREIEAVEPVEDAVFDVRLVVENTDFIMACFYNTEGMTGEQIEEYLNPTIDLTNVEYEIDSETGIFIRRSTAGEKFYRFKTGKLPLMGIGQLVNFK